MEIAASELQALRSEHKASSTRRDAVRIVLDPNVLVSAALSSNGPSAQILAEDA